MRDLRRISVAACFLLVLLRMSIGWQFLYEGLWKFNTLSSAHPWSAEGYLKNAQGPFREFFRGLTGDPDDLGWLDPETVAGKWDAWHERFLAHYPDLDESQTVRLDWLLNGPPEFTASLKQLPDNERFRKFFPRFQKVVTYDKDRKLLVVDGKRHLTTGERDLLFHLVTYKKKDPTEAEKKQNKIALPFRKAVLIAWQKSRRLSYKEQLDALLKGDPELVTIVNERQAGTVDEKRIGKIDQYHHLLERYERQLAAAKEDFEFEHLKHLAAEIRSLRKELVGPVKALDAELKRKAGELLTQDQLTRGPVPPEITPLYRADRLTIWSLLVLGILLIGGLFTRLSAVAGAGMLLSFYLVMPPWPGVPPALGPEHSLIVNKNLIEVIALLAIAFMPTGQWFGIDSLLRAICCRKCRKASGSVSGSATNSVANPVTPSTGKEAAPDAGYRLASGKGKS